MVKFYICICSVFMVGHSFGQLTQVYELEEVPETIFGEPIPTTGHFDQPIELHLYDSTYVVVNDFGEARISFFDWNFEFLGTAFYTTRPSNLFFRENQLCHLYPPGVRCFDFNELVSNENPKPNAIRISITLNSNGVIQSLRDSTYILFNPEAHKKDRITLFNEKFKVIRSFGQIPQNLVDSTLKINYYLNATAEVNEESVFVGYQFSDYLEKYAIESGILETIAHEANTQFPPDYSVRLNQVGIPDDDYSYYTKLKASGDKLFALYKYGVPGMPKREDEPMKLLIFDEESLELLDQYALDEDLVDLVILDDTIIGLCYYCAYPLRRYSLGNKKP